MYRTEEMFRNLRLFSISHVLMWMFITFSFLSDECIYFSECMYLILKWIKLSGFFVFYFLCLFSFICLFDVVGFMNYGLCQQWIVDAEMYHQENNGDGVRVFKDLFIWLPGCFRCWLFQSLLEVKYDEIILIWLMFCS